MSDVETGNAEAFDLNARLLAVARKIVEVAGGKARLAKNEEDDTTNAQPQAAHFLKVDEKRFGRDIEVYGVMGQVGGNIDAVATFLGEVAMPLRCTLDPDAHTAVMAEVEQLGAEVCPESARDKWHAIFRP